jgi:putative transposase
MAGQASRHCASGSCDAASTGFQGGHLPESSKVRETHKALSRFAPADVHDTKGARCLLAGLAFFVPRLKKIWADAAYRGQELAEWCQITGSWELEVVERTPGTRGWSRVPRRWVVERTFSWISRNRRLSKDYERKVQTSETLIQVAMIRLLLTRLGRKSEPVPTHKERAA